MTTVGLHPTDQIERGHGGGPGGDDVVDHRHPAATHGRDPGRIQPEHLGAPVVIDRTGSANVSPRWVFGVLWRMT